MSAGLEGSMVGMKALTPQEQAIMAEMQRAQAEQQALLHQRTQQAQEQQAQAQQAMQQAVMQPPQQPGFETLIPLALGNLASIVGQTPQPFEEAKQGVQQTKSDLLKTRAANLKQLQDVYMQRAEEAQKAGDLEATEGFRRKYETLNKTLDAVQTRLDRESRERTATTKAATGGGSVLPPEDTNAIADAIARGDQPPVFTGLYRSGGPVRAALARKGINVTKLQADWNSLTRHYASLNGTIQLRLRQAAENARGSVELTRDLNEQLSALNVPRSRLTALNRASMAVIRNGVFGDDAAGVATQLEGQIAALQSELSNVYQGGGVPTDEARKMAQHVINAQMSPARLRAALELASRDIGIRLNAVSSVGAISPSNPGTAGQTNYNIGPNPLPLAQPESDFDFVPGKGLVPVKR